MKFQSVLLVCLALGLVSGAVACVTESTGTDDGSGGLNPQPLPPKDDTGQGGKEATGAADSTNGASSSSSGAPPTSPEPADAGTDG